MNFMRRKPPQLSTYDELHTVYEDTANSAIQYLGFEEQNKFQQALNGWKSLHTSLSYKIEYYNKIRKTDEEEELFNELKSIRDQNIKHLIRVQLRCDEHDRLSQQSSRQSATQPPQPGPKPHSASSSRSNSHHMNVPSLRNNHTMNRKLQTTRPMLKSLRPGKYNSLTEANSSAASQAANLCWKQDDAARHSQSTSHIPNYEKSKDSYDSVFNDFDQDIAEISYKNDDDNGYDENLIDLVAHYNELDLDDYSGDKFTTFKPLIPSLNISEPTLVTKQSKYSERITPPIPPPHMKPRPKQSSPKPTSQPNSRNTVPQPSSARPASAPRPTVRPPVSSQPKSARPLASPTKQGPPKMAARPDPKPSPKFAAPKPTHKPIPKPTYKTPQSISKQKVPINPTKPKSTPPSAARQAQTSPRTLQNRGPKHAINKTPNFVDEDDAGIKKDTETLSSGESEKGSEEVIEIIDDIDEDELIKSIKGIDQNAAKQILNEIVVHGDEVYWEDIAGLDGAKNSLKEAVVYPFLRPDLFSGLREPARGMLLFGPPGTGKTMLARAVATESKSTFFSISASSLTSKYLGESEKLVRALFMLAKKLAPSIVFIDEIDSLLSSRSDGEVDSSRRIKNEFLIQWSDLSSAASRDKGSDLERVLILGATNIPWGIDEAARRRFVRRQYIPLPEAETRKAQILKLLVHQKHTLLDDELSALVELTDSFSGSDITALAKDAAMGPLRSLGDKLLSTPRENIRPIGLIDFESSLKYIRPSVSKEGLKQYEEWASKFGSSGV